MVKRPLKSSFKFGSGGVEGHAYLHSGTSALLHSKDEGCAVGLGADAGRNGQQPVSNPARFQSPATPGGVVGKSKGCGAHEQSA